MRTDPEEAGRREPLPPRQETGAGAGRRPVRVILVDDSRFFRARVRRALEATGRIRVVAEAGDGDEALERAADTDADVLTLDIEMPRMDGLTALAHLMRRHPLPVVMLSSRTRIGAEATVEALRLGAIDFVAKPDGLEPDGFRNMVEQLTRRVLLAATAGLSHAAPARSDAAPQVPRRRLAPGGLAERVVVIGASTGGPQALYRMMPLWPAELDAGVILVQHMPRGFTRSLAAGLDRIAPIAVREAEEDEPVLSRQALVAPAGYHLRISPRRRVRLGEDPPQHGVRPSVDPTLESAAAVWGAGLVSVILTGMGADGTRGSAAVRAAGGRVIAQSEATCVVYGMPRSVVTAGLADRVLDLEAIPAAVAEMLGNER
ncbi:MAG: chemotaxis response regulator protein-glutamate methylesterase [Bacillota bacterium]|nr:chemotaxis response regulator protein-glutamate methylesterase [Bacillota bacterium]